MAPTPAEVDAAMQRTHTAGATVPKEPQCAAFGGYRGYFADPDGLAGRQNRVITAAPASTG